MCMCAHPLCVVEDAVLSESFSLPRGHNRYAARHMQICQLVFHTHVIEFALLAAQTLEQRNRLMDAHTSVDTHTHTRTSAHRHTQTSPSCRFLPAVTIYSVVVSAPAQRDMFMQTVFHVVYLPFPSDLSHSLHIPPPSHTHLIRTTTAPCVPGQRAALPMASFGS